MEQVQGLVGEEQALVRESDPPGMLSSLRTLARAMLSLTDDPAGHALKWRPGDRERRRNAGMARQIYLERRRRTSFFPASLFGEPAWDMLLDLYHALESNELRSIKSICVSSNVPEATASRYIDKLHAAGLVERICDKTDGRRKFLKLTPRGQRSMQDYLQSMQITGDHGDDVIRFLAQQGLG